MLTKFLGLLNAHIAEEAGKYHLNNQRSKLSTKYQNNK